MRTSESVCSVCGYVIRNTLMAGSAGRLPSLLHPSTTLAETRGMVTCPTCQSRLDPQSSDRYCPACNTLISPRVTLTPLAESLRSPNQQMPLADRGTTQNTSQTSSGVVYSARLNNYGQGTVIGDPIQLQDEPRDADPLQVIVSLLLLLELAAILATVSIAALVVGVVILALALVFSMTGGMFAMGCMFSLIRAPMTMIANAMRMLFSGISPRLNPVNYRHVHEYHIDLLEGSQRTFVVKGNTSPRTLRSGDGVRIWTVQRRGRPYLRQGFLDENGTSVPIRVSEPANGVQWLVGFVILNLFLAFIYFTYFNG